MDDNRVTAAMLNHGERLRLTPDGPVKMMTDGGHGEYAVIVDICTGKSKTLEWHHLVWPVSNRCVCELQVGDELRLQRDPDADVWCIEEVDGFLGVSLKGRNGQSMTVSPSTLAFPVNEDEETD